MNRIALGALGALALAGLGLFWLQGRAEVERGAPPPAAQPEGRAMKVKRRVAGGRATTARIVSACALAGLLSALFVSAANAGGAIGWATAVNDFATEGTAVGAAAVVLGILADAVPQVPFGDITDPETVIGPLASATQLEIAYGVRFGAPQKCQSWMPSTTR